MAETGGTIYMAPPHARLDLAVGKELLTDAIVRFDAGHPAAQRVR